MRVLSSASVAVVVALLPLGAGCPPPFIVTDSFTEVPPGALSSPPDSLHDYVVGTEVRLDVRAARAFVDLNAVEVVSKTPELIEVIQQVRVADELRVHLRALQEGTASLALLDEKQRPIEERVVEVKLPDEVVLAVNIDTDRGYTIPLLDPDGLLIAAAGSATFRVSYTRDGGEVMGTNVLRAPGAAAEGVGVAFENPVRNNPDREFVTLGAPGEASDDSVAVPFEVDGQVITTIQVRATSLDEVATIQLDEGTLPSWRNNGDKNTVWAKAFTEDAVPVFGVPFAWSFDSAAIEGSGDLITYEYAGGENRRIQVTAGEAVEDLTVEAAAGSAKLASTANAGCASTATAPTGSLAALALVLFALSVSIRCSDNSRGRRSRAAPPNPACR